MLSVVLGLVLSPRGAPGIAALYAHLLGRPYAPGDPERYNAPLREHLLACFPGLSTFRAGEVPTYEFVGDWVRRRAREFGTYLVVPPLPAADGFDTGAAADAHSTEHATATAVSLAEAERDARVPEPWDVTPTPNVPCFAPTPDEAGPVEVRVAPDGL